MRSFERAPYLLQDTFSSIMWCYHASVGTTKNSSTILMLAHAAQSRSSLLLQHNIMLPFSELSLKEAALTPALIDCYTKQQMMQSGTWRVAPHVS
jgi:hypothetical protein